MLTSSLSECVLLLVIVPSLRHCVLVCRFFCYLVHNVLCGYLNVVWLGFNRQDVRFSAFLLNFR